MINYTTNPIVQPEQISDLLHRANQKRDPENARRLARVVPEANLVIAAFDGNKLVGMARGLKEMNGCCYLSDLIVDLQYQPWNIGENLIRHVSESIGEHALVMLVRAADVAVYNTDVG